MKIKAILKHCMCYRKQRISKCKHSRFSHVTLFLSEFFPTNPIVDLKFSQNKRRTKVKSLSKTVGNNHCLHLCIYLKFFYITYDCFQHRGLEDSEA